MSMTKTEQRKLRSLRKEANKLAKDVARMKKELLSRVLSDAKHLAKRVDKELTQQMKKS